MNEDIKDFFAVYCMYAMPCFIYWECKSKPSTRR